MFNLFLKGHLRVIRLCLLAATLALIAIGIATIYSVGHPAEPSPASQTEDLTNFWKKQVVFAVIAFVAFITVNMVNYRRLGEVSYWIYAFVLLLLAALLLNKLVDIRIGNLLTMPLRRGTRRWIQLSIAGQSISLQPSEICKLAYILALAWYLRFQSNNRNFRALIGPFILTLLPMVLILLEPDLGTVMLMMPVLFSMLFVAGAKVKHLLIIVFMAILVSPLLWSRMEHYQRARVSSVLLQSSWIRQKAEQHPTLGKILVGTKFSEKLWKSDLGYQLIRSKYAVASGGAKGYGFRRGPFVKYDFLDARHNDFIFAIIAEQWGFWGCLALFALYGIIVGCGLKIAIHNTDPFGRLLVFWGCLALFALYGIIVGCGLKIAIHNTDPFGRLLVVGIVAMFVVEVIVNVNMTVGLMPITGLTLPFVSYGGSSLLVSMAAVGLLNNVGRRRPLHLAR
jgi:cell division protein FtsW (lipid II flippase)